MQSADTYFYPVGYRFYQRGGTRPRDWASVWAWASPTGIDIPGEVAGRIPTPAWKRQYFKTAIDKIWEPGDSIQLAVGQGNMEATPLQLATATRRSPTAAPSCSRTWASRSSTSRGSS